MSRERQPSSKSKRLAHAPGSNERARATVFECGSDTFAVLSFPTRDLPLPAALSAAVQEICGLLLSGASNAEIAKRRGTRLRTIANQVASILRKLGAASRSELPTALVRRDP